MLLSTIMKQDLIIRMLPEVDYSETWQKMQTFTVNRDQNTPDELWLLQHPPVYTQGQAGKAEHVLNPGQIPIVQTDRGGQITYHGPGQLVAYVLFDIRRLGIGIRSLVEKLESAVIKTLAEYGVTAAGRRDAPGVYIESSKICSIGLRVKKGCSYHGIAFNIDMDLSPFQGINPCGFQGLEVTQVKQFVPSIAIIELESKFIQHIIELFRYNAYEVVNERVEHESIEHQG